MSHTHVVTTQKQLLLDNLMEFYNQKKYLEKMIEVINGESKISLRIVDWFVTNYAKKYFTVYEVPKIVNGEPSQTETARFKVFHEYKLKLKAYAKKNFDPFCRWERITIPYDKQSSMETTIGQLNFFKWAIENRIIDYIQTHYAEIEDDMNNRNSTSKRKTATTTEKSQADEGKTRKKREELSISACKCIKKENVTIVVKFNE
jgi:sulfur relay (sulfurtransferase) DsrC/TusE family protein